MPTAPDLGERLGKLVRMLLSDAPGERANAAAAIARTLQSGGFTIHDLAYAAENLFSRPPSAVRAPSPTPRRSRRPKPPPPPSRCPQTAFQQAAGEILRVGLKALTKRENEFLTTILEWEGRPTEKQLRWLLTLAARFGVEVERG
jgi:hypothetical protein